MLSKKYFLPLLFLLTIPWFGNLLAQDSIQESGAGYIGPVYSTDSLRKMLVSNDRDQEVHALWYINEKIQGDIPITLVKPVLLLLEREWKHPKFTPRDEDHYMSPFMDLVIAAWRTKDPTARRGIVMSGGIGVSGGIDKFIGEDIRPLFHALDSIAMESDFESYGIINIYGLAIAKNPEQLRRADSTHIIGMFLDKISDTSYLNRAQVAEVVGKIPLPEFMPALVDLRSSDKDSGIREHAVTSIAMIESQWKLMPPQQLLYRLDLALEAFCDQPTNSKLRKRCPNFKQSLREADRHIRARKKPQALEALKEFSRGIVEAHNQGAIHRTQKAFFKWNADAVARRL